MSKLATSEPAHDEGQRAVVEELQWRSPTLPPTEDPDAPPVGSTLTYVVGLLTLAGTMAWFAVPFVH